MARRKKAPSIDDTPDAEPIDSSGESSGSDSEELDGESSEEEYDSAAEHEDGDGSDEPEVSDQYEDDSEDGFEDQGSSDDEDDRVERQADLEDGESDDEIELLDEIQVDAPRSWPRQHAGKRGADGTPASNGPGAAADGGGKVDDPATSRLMHTDDLSSDDEDPDGSGNRIGRVPLHWYDEYDHVGYDGRGSKVVKSQSKDLLSQVLENEDDADKKRFVVHDALNSRDVELTPRQIELIRRMQGGAYAHPEFDSNPDYIDYFSGVDPIKSGLNSDKYEKKARFQPSKWEALQVRRLLHRLKCGSISQEFLEGKVRDMNDLIKRDADGTDGRPFALWRGDEEDELALRKGPQHMPAPKVPPPGHAFSYNPPEEYLPNEEELKEWEELDPEDRPYGRFVPKKFDNLRSVGAYEHSVKERFERCLDLYLCPRAMKRRLNIDPESLVPRLPRASDLRPFPTARVVEYTVPGREEHVVVRCITASPDGQFLASGDEEGAVRIWEVQTGRLLRSWDLNDVVGGGRREDGGDGDGEDEDDAEAQSKKQPITSIEWNPNGSHHCLLASIDKCAVVLATGTGGLDGSEVTDALLSASSSVRKGSGGNIPPDSRAAKAVSWSSLARQPAAGGGDSAPISAFGGRAGPAALLRTNSPVTSARWHRKGDYFVTVSPRAGAASVLIHQLSKATSQQPFGKAKGGETQLACFHPRKPFLFVATKEHVRVYHLVKQTMVKRLMSGCRHISTIDVHASGDHVIVGSLDRRLVWFDLDLAGTPYRTLKYHERALRSVGFHTKYPLMASASDDGTVHVFHSMVYSDLMRNPLIVPVKVLRGHGGGTGKSGGLGALAMVWHPSQPWLFSAGADGRIHLFQDL